VSAGIGRAKELNLDQMILRWQYVARGLRARADEQEHELRALTRHPYAKAGVAAALVFADALHDVEKKLAKLIHVLESRS
jgi:hypothetical protein